MKIYLLTSPLKLFQQMRMSFPGYHLLKLNETVARRCSRQKMAKIVLKFDTILREIPDMELFLSKVTDYHSVFCCIGTEYGEIKSIPLYSVRMRGNTDQKNSEYKHFHVVYRHTAFPVNSAYFFRTTFLKITCKRLLLH